MKRNKAEQVNIKKFYDEVYYAKAVETPYVPKHFYYLNKKIQVTAGQAILDVACGTGQWLKTTTELGAHPFGVDISQKAIDICKKKLPKGIFHCGPAESLPFSDSEFDIVTCFGALEHFIDPPKALLEMVRVARSDAKFVFLVPNSDFLTAKIGIYKGTHQRTIKEETRTIEEWNTLFKEAGLQVSKKCKDLHILSWTWISHGTFFHIPLRLIQAIMLPFWPLRWQYQIYFLCRKQI